jgi:Transglycosylase-like domain
MRKTAAILLASACAFAPAAAPAQAAEPAGAEVVGAADPAATPIARGVRPAGAEEVGAADPAVTPIARGVRPAGGRLQRAYQRWRRKLRRYEVWRGRDLVAAARTAQRPPTARELSHSIHRMQRRFHRFLRTPRGRAARFGLKVRQIPAWGRGHLHAIAACESRHNPRAVGGGGSFRGMYQFTFGTWRVVGGTGDPAAAPRSEQSWRAWLLLSRHGSGHWPVCG